MNAILWAIVFLCLLIQFVLLQRSQTDATLSGLKRQLVDLPAFSTSESSRGTNTPFDEVHVVFATHDFRKGHSVVSIPSNPIRIQSSHDSTAKRQETARRDRSDQQSEHMLRRQPISDIRTQIYRIPRKLYTIHLSENHKLERLAFQEASNRYLTAWSNGPQLDPPTVEVLTDTDCRITIQATEPNLLALYESFADTSHQEGLCRMAALISSGGYVLGTNYKVVQPWEAQKETHQCRFVAVIRQNNLSFSTSFLATTAENEVVKLALSKLLTQWEQHMTGATDFKHTSGNIDPGRALFEAYQQLHGDTQATSSEQHCLLMEIDPQVEGDQEIRQSPLPQWSASCHGVVHDTTNVYMLSSNSQCILPQAEKLR